MIAQQPDGLDRDETVSAQRPRRVQAPGTAGEHEGAKPVEEPPAGSLPDTDSLARLGGIEVRAAVELGAADLLLRDLAALANGSVVRLDRLVGEPADLTVNGRLFAHGDLVLVGDRLGFRITDVIGAGDRSRGRP
ncbi:MAG: FliM/FliN family flagellar motor switch protein [Armatimonadota bacterium]|nr:MAG: FliM/FliN family flagellar motor switch protein [Armatimonadota bacterium]